MLKNKYCQGRCGSESHSVFRTATFYHYPFFTKIENLSFLSIWASYTSTCDGMWMNISLNHSRPRQYFMICIYKKSNKLLRWEYLQTKSTLNVSFPIVPSVWGACPAGERLSVIVSEPTYHTTHIQPDTLRPARNQTDSWISWEENCWNIWKIIKTLTWL